MSNMMVETHLDIHLLGAPQVQHNDDVIAFATAKSLALLIYLLVESGRHTREKLAAFFWPESDTGRARANLRLTLSYVRAALPRTARGETRHLSISRDSLAFDAHAPFTLDLDLVRAALQKPTTTAQLAAAVDLARGDFLEGFSLPDAPAFDTWASFQREFWHRQIDLLFERLSREQSDQGLLPEAMSTTGRWLRHNPLQEAAYRRLMRLHLAAGDRVAAQQAYEACRHRLREALDVAPAPETQALAARLDEPQWTPARPASRPTADIESPRFAEGPLVGRAAEFAALVARFHEAADGRPQAVAVIGEAGIGKTRLATDFSRWAAAHGADVLLGRAYETSGQVPYQPLAEALRRRVEQINAPEDYLADSWLAELSRLLPELHDRYPDLPRLDLDNEAARTRLFEGVVRFTAALAERRPRLRAPVLWLLDDLQWSDAATRDLLTYAAPRWQAERTPLLLLFTVRSEALHPLAASAAAGWLADLDRSFPLTTHSLSPLSPDAIGRFVAAFTEPEATGRAAIVSWLHEETGGQPFYLIETLRDLLDRHVVTPYRDESGAARVRLSAALQAPETLPHGQMPDRVRQVILARLNRLAAPARTMLVAVATLGRAATYAQLCQVAAVAEDDALAALDELLGSGLLREGGDGYLLAHDKIRDVVYTEAGAARRRVFHRRAWLNLTTANASASLLAHHALAAGEVESAFRHNVAAGNEALRLHAAGKAVEHYRVAQGLLDRVNADEEELAHYYRQFGRALEYGGDHEQALRQYERLAALASETGNDVLALTALVARTTIYSRLTGHYDPQKARDMSQEGLAMARALGDRVAEARILWSMMMLTRFSGQTRQAITYGEASLAVARQYALPEAQARALQDLYLLYRYEGQNARCLAVLQEAQPLWRQLNNPRRLAENMSLQAKFHAFVRGDFARGLALAEAALALSEEIGDLWGQSFVRIEIGYVQAMRGELGRALRTIEVCIELGDQAGFHLPSVDAANTLALLYAYLGAAEKAVAWAQRTRQKAQALNPTYIPMAEATLGRVYLLQGDIGRAAPLVEAAFAAVELAPIGGSWLPVYLAAAELALARGEPATAVDVTDEMMRRQRQRNLHIFSSDALLIKGRALRALGQDAAATVALEEARETAARQEIRLTLWPIVAELAALADNAERAASYRRQAWQLVETISTYIDDPALRAGFLARAAHLGVVGVGDTT